MALPVNLAGNDIIDETWVDAVVTELTALPGRYAPLAPSVPYAQVVANQTPINAEGDLTGLTVTYTAVAGRRYRITAKVEITSSVADGVYVVKITDAANVGLQRATDACLTTSSRSVTLVYSAVAAASGATTRKLRASKIGGTGTLTMGCAADYPAFIMVEDIGV